MSALPLMSSSTAKVSLVCFVKRFRAFVRSHGLNALARLAMICVCGAPPASLAQSDQLPPWSIQRVATSVLRKMQTSTPMLAGGSGWTAAAPYPTSIYDCGFAQNGEHFYIISGITGNTYTSPVTAVRRYNVSSNTWTSLADIPRGSVLPPAIYYKGKIYVGDGFDYSSESNTLRIYDITTNTWSAGPPTPVSQNSGSAAAAFNGNIYFVGQSNFSSMGGTTSIYSIVNNSWSDGPPPPASEIGANPGYAQIGQYLYLVGGVGHCSLPGCFNSDSSVRFDMASNTWSIGPRATFRRSDFALVAVGNTLVAIGGDPDGGTELGFSSEVYQLDTTTWPNGTWKRLLHDLPAPRGTTRAGFFTTSRAGGEVWCTGGLGITSILSEHIFLPLIVTKGDSAILVAGANGVFDPGERVTVGLGVRKELTVDDASCTTSDLTGTLLPAGGVTDPSLPQNYGALCSGHSASRNFTFTVDPALPCGSDMIVSLAMTDGLTNYGTLNYVFTTGNLAPIFSENFDAIVAPALPKGWETSTLGYPFLWATSTTGADSPPNAVVITEVYNNHQDSDCRLDSPPIPISSAYTKVEFRHKYSCYPAVDGGLLEVSSPNINGGAFTDITDAAVGGSFIAGGYDRFFGVSSPVGHRFAWGDSSGGYITTIANLGPHVEGQTIRLRFRLVVGGFAGQGYGWSVDSFSVQTPVCGGNAPAVISAVSRKAHGGVGAFDIDLPLVPLDANIGIENRSGPVDGQHQIVVQFASPVTLGSASVTTGTGAASASVGGDIITLDLTGVTNAQRLGLTLADVSDGSNLGNVIIPIGVLLGDADANGVVNASDVSQTKSQSGTPVTNLNFRKDVTGNGAIDASDVTAVKSKSGTALP